MSSDVSPLTVLIGGVNSACNENIQLINQGIDTFDIGLYVDFYRTYHDWVYTVEEYRNKARELREPQKVEGIGSIDDFIVHGSIGQRGYKFHLDIPTGQLFIRNQSTFDHTPNVIYKPFSMALWLDGFKACWADCTGALKALGGVVHEHHVNQLAICCDIAMTEKLTYIDWCVPDRWHKAKIPGWDAIADNVGQGVGTLYIGDRHKATRWLKVYNKKEEMEQHENWYMNKVYDRQFMRPMWNIYRFEWTAKYRYLKDKNVRKIEDVYDLDNDALWGYGLSLWNDFCENTARHTIGNNKQTSRRKSCPIWEIVTHSQGMAEFVLDKRDMRKYQPKASDYYAEKAIEAIAKFTAIYSLEMGEPYPYEDFVGGMNDLWNWYKQAGRELYTMDFVKRVDELKKQSIRRQKDWEDYNNKMSEREADEFIDYLFGDGDKPVASDPIVENQEDLF